MRLLPKSRTLNIHVITAESELEFSVQDNIKGLRLFDQVVRTIGLREVWYFGLIYEDDEGHNNWVNLERKLSSLHVKNKKQILLHFCVKFYPEDVTKDLIQETTLRLFFLQVKESILKNEILCPPETAVLLASYALQAKYVDYECETLSKMSIPIESILPPSFLENHDVTDDECMNMILKWYRNYAGMSVETAMLTYLNIAQELDTYGIDFFPITNRRKTKLLLGIDSMGLTIYIPPERSKAKLGFSWCEIRNISFTDRKFSIKALEQKSPDLIFFTENLRDNKLILALCVGNNELYLRRRQPDSIELQQMRAQANDVIFSRNVERNRLKKEIKARQVAEQRLKEIENSLAVTPRMMDCNISEHFSSIYPQEHSSKIQKDLNMTP